jgi:(p)ppGpp synthase/HD superfamily hydrolase
MLDARKNHVYTSLYRMGPEDAPVTINEIKETFGWHVAELVGAASEPDKSDTWENRKNHTIEMLKILSEEALILVLADKMDNIRAIREDYERYGEELWRQLPY